VTFVLALDQGTTGSAALVFDETGVVRGSADRETRQSYPASGHVEHDPEEIFATTVAVGRDALAEARIGAKDVAAIGITNQRETTVVWERATGRPIHPAVVWQSRASAQTCEALRARGLEELVRERTGLVIDAYFSATKVRWILDQVPGAQARAAAGELLCGTIDTWLVWKLTGGRIHATDVSNASRTMVFDIHRGAWDEDLLRALDLPRSLFGTAVRSSGIIGEWPELYLAIHAIKRAVVTDIADDPSGWRLIFDRVGERSFGRICAQFDQKRNAGRITSGQFAAHERDRFGVANENVNLRG